MNHLFASLMCVNTFSHEYFTGEFHPAPPSWCQCSDYWETGWPATRAEGG
jgi:hypothetical protein